MNAERSQREGPDMPRHSRDLDELMRDEKGKLTRAIQALRHIRPHVARAKRPQLDQIVQNLEGALEEDVEIARRL